MKKGGSKGKGDRYERTICEKLTKVYYPDGDGEFRRVPRSGGWDKRVAPGDIIPLKIVRGTLGEGTGTAMVIDTSFPFLIECKNWRDVGHFFVGLYAKESVMFSWLSQAKSDVGESKKIPVVAFRLFHQDDVCILRNEDFSMLVELFGLPDAKFYKMSIHRISDIKVSSGPVQNIDIVLKDGETIQVNEIFVFLLLDKFLSWVNWETYKLMSYSKYIRSLIPKGEV